MSTPDGNPIPSGYYNDYTIDYRQTRGDAAGARSVKEAKNTSFRNAVFEVYEPKGQTNTIYDGYNTAKKYKAN